MRRGYIIGGTLLAAIIVFVIATAANAQADPEANDPDYWCQPEQGVKYEPVDTPFIVPEPEEGRTWTLLVLKAATTNETVDYPTPGVGYSHSSGQENSHTILCWEEAAVTTTTSSTTSSTSSTTTTTTIPITTTTVPATTTSSSTTTTSTTVTVTTTDPPSSSTTSLNPPSTVPPTTTTPPTLPNTGSDYAGYIVVGLVLIAAGWLAILAFGRNN